MMALVWHIFRKDVGHLRLDIALALLGSLFFALLGIYSAQGPGPAAFILPVIWWFLIAKVIHLEPLPGKRHFWLTRPYERRTLFAAKCLFILFFVNAPLMFADIAVLYAKGFPILSLPAGLLWKQLLLTGAFILPTAAIAAITSGLVEFLIVTVLLVFGFLAWAVIGPMIHWGSYWMEIEWIKTYYLGAQIAIVSSGVLAWQYSRRKTSAIRVAVLMSVVAIGASSLALPWNAGFALQSRLSPRGVNLSAFRIELDSQRTWLARCYLGDDDQVVTELPLRISGLPTGTQIKPLGLTLFYRGPHEAMRKVNQPPPELIEFEAGLPSLRVVLARNAYSRLKDEPLNLRGDLYFTLLGHKRSAYLPLQGDSVRVQGVGFCSADVQLISCSSAFRTPSYSTTVLIEQQSSTGRRSATEPFPPIPSYTPFPADFSLSPLNHFSSPRLSSMLEARVETIEPLAYLRRSFEISSVTLDKLANLESTERR